jgi:hypothetical protein
MNMKLIYSGFLILILTIVASQATAQTTLTPKEDSIFKERGEIYFKFTMSNKVMVDSLSRLISIDNYQAGEVYAYATIDQFMKFHSYNIAYVILPSPGTQRTPEELNMGNMQKSPNNMTIWNFYPTYPQYLSIMSTFASTYPSICRLDTIGRANSGRLLLALKISDSVNYDRVAAPQVLLTSSIHGDEYTGYIMMLHLIDTLLNSYGTNTRLTNIVHNTQLYINPLANPDGTYYGGDGTVGNARRGNQFNVDMNRNYPDPAAGQHPDGKQWQTETMAFMDFADHHHLTMSANFHGGAEVVNYPWDTWSRLTPDDSWWQYVSKEFADTCHRYGPSGYFTNPFASGYSDGYAWYSITGGRQDYHNYFKHDREVTIEISNTKNPAASTLLTFWKSLHRSLLNFIEQSSYGINGKVYDSVTYSPIAAKILITTHDADSSFIYSTLPTGWYNRLIDTGPWNLTFSAPGYYSRTITGVSVAHHSYNRQNVKLRPIDVNWPRSFLATAISGNEIDLSWGKNGNGNPVMIAASTTNTFGTPANGTTYNPGTSLAGGGTIIYNGGSTAFAHNLLDPNTTWYYRAWSVGAGNIYSTSAYSSTTTLCGTYTSFPFTENFTTATTQLPNCWSQDLISGVTSTYTSSWIRSNTNIAGGASAWEMRLPRNSTVTSGTIRLKTFSFSTVGVSTLNLTFRNYVDGRNPGTGATLKVQTSSDGINWTDEWSLATTNGNIAASTIAVSITHNLGNPSTMIAFTATGNLSNFDYWYIDDVVIKAPGYWVGGTAGALTDWNTVTNWGDGLVPVAGTNVYIPLRTYLPVVSPANANCNNLIIAPNSKITVGSGRQITVNGKLTLQAP